MATARGLAVAAIPLSLQGVARRVLEMGISMMSILDLEVFLPSCVLGRFLAFFSAACNERERPLRVSCDRVMASAASLTE